MINLTINGKNIEVPEGTTVLRAVDSDPNPFVRVDMNKCILCTRCVRACSEIQGRFVWSQAERGFNTQIVAGAGTDMLDARCESCGACVAYCPTGALENKMSINAGVPDKAGYHYLHLLRGRLPV
jgi:NADH dehydrogenase/NADH:ubiquinone oxidoreductase subunit G